MPFTTVGQGCGIPSQNELDVAAVVGGGGLIREGSVLIKKA